MTGGTRRPSLESLGTRVGRSCACNWHLVLVSRRCGWPCLGRRTLAQGASCPEMSSRSPATMRRAACSRWRRDRPAAVGQGALRPCRVPTNTDGDPSPGRTPRGELTPGDVHRSREYAAGGANHAQGLGHGGVDHRQGRACRTGKARRGALRFTGQRPSCEAHAGGPGYRLSRAVAVARKHLSAGELREAKIPNPGPKKTAVPQLRRTVIALAIRRLRHRCRGWAGLGVRKRASRPRCPCAT